MKSTLIYEEWKPVPNYEGLYDISNFGKVRGLDRLVKYINSKIVFHKGGILRPGKNAKGYLTVILCKDKKETTFLVHRLVYETFNGTIPVGMQVNHINEIKTDNSVWNLNLMTPKENSNWGSAIKKSVEKRSDPVLQLTPDGQLVKEWPSMNEAERNGFSSGCISLCCQGKIKMHKGFKWVKKNPA